MDIDKVLVATAMANVNQSISYLGGDLQCLLEKMNDCQYGIDDKLVVAGLIRKVLAIAEQYGPLVYKMFPETPHVDDKFADLADEIDHFITEML